MKEGFTLEERRLLLASVIDRACDPKKGFQTIRLSKYEWIALREILDRDLKKDGGEG